MVIEHLLLILLSFKHIILLNEIQVFLMTEIFRMKSHNTHIHRTVCNSDPLFSWVTKKSSIKVLGHSAHTASLPKSGCLCSSVCKTLSDRDCPVTVPPSLQMMPFQNLTNITHPEDQTIRIASSPSYQEYKISASRNRVVKESHLSYPGTLLSCS